MAMATAPDRAAETDPCPTRNHQIGFMHTLFTFEVVYGLAVSQADGEVCLKANKDKRKETYELL